LWVVRCRQTSQVLSWRISEGRFFHAAKKLMQDALSVAGTDLNSSLLMGFISTQQQSIKQWAGIGKN